MSIVHLSLEPAKDNLYITCCLNPILKITLKALLKSLFLANCIYQNPPICLVKEFTI